MGKVRKAITIPLPVGSLGISIKGCPPVISKIYDDSPVTELVQEGYVVEKLVFQNDGTTISGMSKVSLAEMLSKTKHVPNRVLICKEHLKSNTKKLPPSVKLGVTFRGTPPTITAVAKDSVMRKKLKTGYIVQSLTLKNGREFTDLTSSELAQLLDDHFHEKNRSLYVDIPPPPYLAKVYLPTGPLGIAFKGTPPRVTQVFQDSPLYGKVQVGTLVESLTLSDGTTYPQDFEPLPHQQQDPDEEVELKTKHLVSLLKETSHDSGRMLRLTKPRRTKVEGPKGTKPGGIWMLQHYVGYMGETEERYVYQEPASTSSTKHLHSSSAPPVVLLYDENGFLVKPGNTTPIDKEMVHRLSGGQMVSSRNLKYRGSINASSMRDFSTTSMRDISTSSRRSLNDSSQQMLLDDSSAYSYNTGRRSSSVGRPNSSSRSMGGSSSRRMSSSGGGGGSSSSRSVGAERRGSSTSQKKPNPVAISLW